MEKRTMSSKLLEVDEARRLVAAAIPRMPIEEVPLLSAHGLVLGKTAHSNALVPPAACSAMDGYAVRAQDLVKGNRVRLRVTQEIMAGDLPTAPLAAGEAARIMTGAPLPDGADTVVMVERTQIDGADGVRIDDAATPGQHVRQQGEDLRPDAAVLAAGARIGSAAIGLLASAGCSRVTVYRRPRVAVLATGDELVPLEETLGAGRIHNSNGPALCAAIREAGGIPLDLGIARDELDHTQELVQRGLAEADCLVTSAGVSVGDRDFVGEAFQAAGVERIFWRVRQKPGKPLYFGVASGKPVFGLPGNPVSSLVIFEQYVRPSIRWMRGLEGAGRHTLRACAAERIAGTPKRLTWVRVELERSPDGWLARPAGAQGSSVLATLARADGLVTTTPGKVMEPGDEVEVRLLREDLLLDA
jgi:molybdopterin molybdotransferase